MPTDPENNSDALVVGLRLLLGEKPDTEQIAKAMHAVMTPNAFLSLMYRMEGHTNVIQPMSIDVDDVLDEVDNNNDVEWCEPYASLTPEQRKAAIRQKMNTIMDWDFTSDRKYQIQDAFIVQLELDGYTQKVVEDEDGHTDAQD